MPANPAPAVMPIARSYRIRPRTAPRELMVIVCVAAVCDADLLRADLAARLESESAGPVRDCLALLLASAVAK